MAVNKPFRGANRKVRRTALALRTRVQKKIKRLRLGPLEYPPLSSLIEKK